MIPEPQTHTLLRVAGPQALHAAAAAPAWVGDSLRRAPWVVIRRASPVDALIPIGVRGASREQRFASWLSPRAILEYVTPRMLVSRRAWSVASPRAADLPALAALDSVARIMREHGLQDCWGPGGSVGFELASSAATATSNSDLDLIVWTDRALTDERARSLHAALGSLAVRTDVLLEMPRGAIALAELFRADGRPGTRVLRTTQGPRLIRNLAEL